MFKLLVDGPRLSVTVAIPALTLKEEGLRDGADVKWGWISGNSVLYIMSNWIIKNPAGLWVVFFLTDVYGSTRWIA